MKNSIQRLQTDYSWIQTPLVIGAPMRLIALAGLAVEISKAGGIGFIGAGTDVSDLAFYLSNAQDLLKKANLTSTNGTLPIGLGFINWGADLSAALPLISSYRPAAVWFFAPSSISALVAWTSKYRGASPDTKIWVQVGSVSEALDVVQSAAPDVLVIQGTDAGGHGLAQGAGIISLFPEVSDAIAQHLSSQGKEEGSGPVLIATGGIADARGTAAALVLGASGVVMGTRFLASTEAVIAKGYQDEVLRAIDGGQTTVRTKVWDNCRGTTGWAETHNGRGIINRSYTDAMGGMGEDQNKRLYEKELGRGDEGWGVQARLCTYAGSAVGLVREVKGAGDIVREVRKGVEGLLGSARSKL